MINIFELNYNRDQKEVKKYRIFRRILDKIHARIKLASKKCISYLFYKIPDFVLGIPAYKIEECSSYISDKLEKNGFVVMFTPPNLFYISWDHIPSSVKYPEIDNFRDEFINNPEKDYSFLVSQLSNNKKQQLLVDNSQQMNIVPYNNISTPNPIVKSWDTISYSSNNGIAGINNPNNWDTMSKISSSYFNNNYNMDITSNANIKSVVVSNNKQSSLDKFSYSYSNQRL